MGSQLSWLPDKDNIMNYLNSQKCIILFVFSIFICSLTIIFFTVPLYNVQIKILIINNMQLAIDLLEIYS